MKMFRRLLMVFLCGAVVSSCFDPPEYPDVPEISFKSINYIQGGELEGGGKAADSIVIVINFKDGDGDIGISADEVAPPFNDRWYYTTQRLAHDPRFRDDCTQYDNKCWFYSDIETEFNKFIDYSDRLESGYDTLGSKYPFDKPFNCTNWEVVYYDDDDNDETAAVPYDTLFFTLNDHYNNLFVDFETKTDDPANPWQLFDEKQFFSYPLCGIRIFRGRIPILSESLGDDTPLEGTIRYAIPSVSFKTIFGSKTLRLRVRIEDRALNRSNEITTREFTLTEN